MAAHTLELSAVLLRCRCCPSRRRASATRLQASRRRRPPRLAHLEVEVLQYCVNAVLLTPLQVRLQGTMGGGRRGAAHQTQAWRAGISDGGINGASTSTARNSA